MVLFDIEKAFDRVWHDGLIYKMIKLNFPHYITKITINFIKERSFQVYVNGHQSTSRPIKFGTPQGCVLSPTLYNTYTYDILVVRHCKLALFADDTALFTTSRLAKSIVKKLEVSSKQLLRYFSLWKIKLNEAKTQAIFFTNRRTKQVPTNPFNFGTSAVNWQNDLKYLGVVLDKKLTFRSHIQEVLTKAQTTIRILYSLLCRKSKLNETNKLLLYKVGIRPILTYAAPLISTIAKTHKQKL